MNDKAEVKSMGAIRRVAGVAFRMWAPHAQRVSVIGSFIGWDGGQRPMISVGSYSVLGFSQC